jgi:hypothetical protein
MIAIVFIEAVLNLCEQVSEIIVGNAELLQ